MSDDMYNNIRVVPQPKNLNIKLFPHQLASIFQMEKLENNNYIERDDYIKETKIGINGDLLGYGKTFSMIGLICRDKMPWDLNTPFVFQTIHCEAKGRIKNYFISRYDKLPCTLILVSPTILSQWENEISKSTLKYKSISTIKHVEDIDIEDILKLDVVIIVPKLYNKIALIFEGYCWKRFIFDEPGNIKVTEMKEIHAGFYWFVTATPNCISQLHRNVKTNSFMKDIVGNSSYNDIDSHLHEIVIRNDPEFIKRSFSMPQTNYFYYDCYQPIAKAVNGFITPTVLTMVQAGNIEGAITSLGGGRTGNIFELIKNKFNEELIIINGKIEIYESRGDSAKVNDWKIKKVEIENKIIEVNNRLKEMLTDNCSICYGELKDPIMEPNCQNIICGECLLTWIHKNMSCPMCRAKIDSKDLIYIETENSKNKKNKEIESRQKTKQETIIEIIHKTKNGSFIIFSEYDNSFNTIIKILQENTIGFVQIKDRSSVKNIEKDLNLFKDKKVPVIFLNSRNNSSGINLQVATDIILYHEMSLSTTNQIIGRANRIGRSIELNVHHLR